MSHADPWAARYGFLRELWSGRARVLADPALEAALRGVKALPASLAALLAELLPVGAGGKSWLLAYDVKPGPARARSQVAAFESFEDVLVEAPWQVAIVDLEQGVSLLDRAADFIGGYVDLQYDAGERRTDGDVFRTRLDQAVGGNRAAKRRAGRKCGRFCPRNRERVLRV